MIEEKQTERKEKSIKENVNKTEEGERCKRASRGARTQRN